MKVVCIYSGGMDSFTLINELHSIDTSVQFLEALSFNYGQRHYKELVYAKYVCKELSIPHKIIDLRSIKELLQGSSLTSDIDVPEGHYENENMKLTVVPNRNMIMLSLAIGYAISIRYDTVAYAAHAGDHAIYPDCRPEFVENIRSLAKFVHYQKINVHTPYLYINKSKILEKGLERSLDYSKSWTCYNGRKKACGKCGSCVERLEAFKLNNVKDPLSYEC